MRPSGWRMPHAVGPTRQCWVSNTAHPPGDGRLTLWLRTGSLSLPEIQALLDDPVSIRCPYCSTVTVLIPISVPRFHLIQRFKLDEVGIVCRCSSCNRAVFLRYFVTNRGNPVVVDEQFEQITRSLEPFEMGYLSSPVADDFREALTCYSNSCWNAFASMCRRCIQSVASSLGADGSNKVQAQLLQLKEMSIADEDTFEQLHQIMLNGHDGAHPHLPALSEERAKILLELLKDVLYQLIVRPKKIQEAAELRKEASRSFQQA